MIRDHFCKVVILLVAVFISPNGWTQTTFSTHILADPVTRATSLALADLDGDNDLDILAGSGNQGLYWFENDGEEAVSFTTHTIDPGFKKVFTVVTGDLDQDGRMDVIAGSYDDHDIIWYRNTGNGQWDKNYIERNLTNVHELFICDMDQDGKPDILAGGAGGNTVQWYRNEMGDPGSWSVQLVDNNFGGVRTVAAADLDDDGDMDIAGGASDVNEVAVWINSGSDPVSWQKFLVSDDFMGSHRIQIADINSDGRPDILGAAWGVNQVAWWENNGESPDTWPKHVLDSALGLSMTALAADVDSDGDLDVIGAGLNNEVSWYENLNADASQWKKKVIDEELAGAWPICGGDLDGDKDLDLVVGGDSGNQIRLYENTTAGLLNGCMVTPDGTYNTGLFIPESYTGREELEVLIVLPGDPHPRAYQILRNFLIPVSQDRGSLILTVDIPRAAPNDYSLDLADYLESTIDYIKEGFLIDEDRIYLMGMTCQGQAVLKEAHEGGANLRGYIGFNPLIPSLALDDWTDPKVPISIAVSDSHPDKTRIDELKGHLNLNQLWIETVDFAGPATDYLIPELAEITIQCMESIEAIHTVGYDDPGLREQTLSIAIKGNGSVGFPIVELSDRIGEKVTLSLFTIQGVELVGSSSITMNSPKEQFPLSNQAGPLTTGQYFLRATNKSGQLATKMIMIVR